MIVNLCKEHLSIIDQNFIEQGWTARTEVLNQYLLEQQSGKRIVLVYEEESEVKGYITLIKNPTSGPCHKLTIPEIVDFNVFEKYQCQGIGQRLLEAIIHISSNFGNLVGIGVGLHPGYGPAQRLYVKNGFIPDGKGVYYRGEIVKQNEPCINDDDLALYFIKSTK